MIDLASIDDIADGAMLRVDIGDRQLCLINISGSIYILDDRCSHADYSLSEGSLDVDAKEVECPKHGALFDVTTGDARCLPATQPVQTYEVVVRDGRILLDEESNNAGN